MANNNPAPQNQNAVDSINESLTDMTRKVEDNKKIIIYAVAGVIVLILLVVGYMQLIRKPAIQKADEAVGRADIELARGNDSIALAQYQAVADEHGYSAGNRAALQAAILLFNDGKYEEAAKYINDYDPTETIVGAAAYSLKGDCYVNLDKLPEAVKAYKDAIKQSDNNTYYTPFFMMKLARVYRAQQDYKAEADIYEEIIKKYPAYGRDNNINLQKYLERARLSAK